MAVVVQFSPQDAKLFQAFAKQEAKLKELAAGYRKLGQGAKRAGKTAERAFDAKRMLKPFIAGLIGTAGITAAIRTVIGLYGEMRQKGKDAATGAATVQSSLKSLVQISGGDPKRFGKLVGTARGLVKDQGFTQLAALDLVFEAISQGFTRKEAKQFGTFREVADPQSLVKAVGGLRGAFGEDVGGGKINAVVNALLVAAAVSNVNVERLAPELLTAAQLVKQQGGTFEELAATLGVISRGAGKSPEIAATQIRALANALKSSDVTFGLGLLGGVEKVLELSVEDRKAIVGKNVRAAGGFGVIVQNLEKIRKSERDIIAAEAATGTSESLIIRSIAIAQSDPTLFALTQAQRAQGGRVLVEQDRLGLPELRVQTIQDMLRSALVREGKGAVAQGLSLKFLDKMATFSNDPTRLTNLAVGLFSRSIEPQRGNPRLVVGFGGIPSLETDPITAGQTAAFEQAVAAFRQSVELLIRGSSGPTLVAPDEDR